MRQPRRGAELVAMLNGATSADHSSGLLVGSVHEIVDELLLEHSLTSMDRLVAQIDIGGLPLRKVASVIELLAREVVSGIRKAFSAPALREDRPPIAAVATSR